MSECQNTYTCKLWKESNKGKCLRCNAVFVDQLDEKSQQLKMTELALEEKRSQLVEAETHAREVEDRYITNASIIHDRTVNDLRVSSYTGLARAY